MLAQSGNYEAALQNAKQVKLLVECAKKNGDYEKLYAIFLNEFIEISRELGDAIQKEKKEGLGISDFDRREARTDYTAKKLYNYKAAKSSECSIQ